MTGPVSRFADQAKLSARALIEYGQHLFNPTIRLGVTGLSRAGKTVFITALVHGLLRGGRFPVFEAHSGGRIAGARLSPQPDDAVPRFEYEKHMRALVEERQWPDSTRHISELRLVIDYQSRNGANRTLTLDLVDYPGEWLLDLPLLGMSYEEWSAESLKRSWQAPRDTLAREWHAHLKTLDPLEQAERERRDRGREIVHAISAHMPRRTLCDECLAAGPVPHAGRSRGFACARPSHRSICRKMPNVNPARSGR